MKLANQFFRVLYFVLFFYTHNSFANAIEFSVYDFKRLAHEMVNDIERTYGPTLVDRGVSFHAQDYHAIIDETKIEFSSKPIDNVYYEDDGFGKKKLVREKNVAAQNFFPKEFKIIYDHSIWAQKKREKQFNELKVMIHHEFVPYFTKAPDRGLIFNKKVEEIYKQKLSWNMLESGFYEVALTDDPAYDTITKFYWFYVGVSRNFLSMQMVENPRQDYWCPACYQVPPTMQVVWNRSSVVPLSRGIEQLNTFAGRINGIHYVQVLAKKSFMISVAEREQLAGTSGNLEETIAKLDQQGVVFEKVTDFTNLSWRKPKKLHLPGIYWGEDQNCNDAMKNYESDVRKACEEFGKHPGVNLSRRDCRQFLTFKITDRKGKAPREKSNCYFTIEGEIPAPASFNPLPFDPGGVEAKLQHWENLLQLEIQRSSSGKE